MTIPQTKLLRLQFLARIVQKEILHLGITDQRLFPAPLTRQMLENLDEHIELAERIDAFVARFGRLQDTVGDKLLPQYLNALGEATGPAIDNLNRAEKFGLIHSAELWITLRELRNQMVHEYMEDIEQLANALNTAHEHVATLSNDAGNILADMASRGWI